MWTDSGPMAIQLLILSFAKKNDMERLPFTQGFASRKLTEEGLMEKQIKGNTVLKFQSRTLKTISYRKQNMRKLFGLLIRTQEDAVASTKIRVKKPKLFPLCIYVGNLKN